MFTRLVPYLLLFLCYIFIMFTFFTRRSSCLFIYKKKKGSNCDISSIKLIFKRYKSLEFVPKHDTCKEEDLIQLQDFIRKYKNLFVLTGAGISTESGLPDYRSKNVGLYDRSASRPVQYKDFISSHEIRKRYWARNFAGWKRFSSAQPNPTHYYLSKWERNNIINWLVTQNVDRLHHKAGSERITELHGNSYIVKCLKCCNLISRHLFQLILKDHNPEFQIESVVLRPDADVELDPQLIKNFNVPNCKNCGGILKPDVVFFGENVKKEIVWELYKKLKQSNALLLLGSSLEVYSGYRFLSAAAEQKKSICIVNIGKTRGDNFANLKLNLRCGDIIPKIKC